ncbi:hypothetical protein JCM24511_02068 [Saitozyma sp. JCM 24511]|nr:hypothetical protein JCM24511_02068 [Saitozyma sp. JCM 24511]
MFAGFDLLKQKLDKLTEFIMDLLLIRCPILPILAISSTVVITYLVHFEGTKCAREAKWPVAFFSTYCTIFTIDLWESPGSPYRRHQRVLPEKRPMRQGMALRAKEAQ